MAYGVSNDPSNESSDEIDSEDDLVHRDYISRRETAALLCLTSSGVRHFESSWLTIKRLVNRTTFYHRRQVEDLVMTRKADKMGTCFNAFREGEQPTAVVAKHGLYAPVVERCWHHYLRMRRGETSVMVVDLDPNMQNEMWLRAFGFDEVPDAAFIRTALELIAQIPDLRARCQRASQRARQHREQSKVRDAAE